MSIRMWFQLREDVDAASTQALRDVAENEATVDGPEFALRLAIHNEGEPDPEPSEDGLVTLVSSPNEFRINVVVPIEVGLRVLDEGRGWVPTLPSSVEGLNDNGPSVVRFAVADRKIGPGDFGIFDLAVTVDPVPCEIPIRAVLNDGSEDEQTEQIRVHVT